MSFRIVYAAPASAIAGLAFAGGRAQAIERATERGLRLREAYESRKFQAEQTRMQMEFRAREAEQERAQRTELFAQETERRQEEQKALFDQQVELSRIQGEQTKARIEEQNQSATKLAVFNSGLHSKEVEDEIKARREEKDREYTAAEKRKVEKIDKDIAAIEATTILAPEEKARLIKEKQLEKAGVPRSDRFEEPRIFDRMDPETGKMVPWGINKDGLPVNLSKGGTDHGIEAMRNVREWVDGAMKGMSADDQADPVKYREARKAAIQEALEIWAPLLPPKVQHQILKGLVDQDKRGEISGMIAQADKIEAFAEKYFASPMLEGARANLLAKATILRNRAAAMQQDAGGAQPPQGEAPPGPPGQPSAQQEVPQGGEPTGPAGQPGGGNPYTAGQPAEAKPAEPKPRAKGLEKPPPAIIAKWKALKAKGSTIAADLLKKYGIE